MLEPAAPGSVMPRAFLRVGGVTLARHQLGIAMALDCRRVICLARDMTRELVALQHDAEAAGIRFHVVPGPRALGGLITGNDDLLVLSEGLLIDRADAERLLEPGHVVLALPIELGMAAGFERLDINHASAGALRIPGRLVERLLELPPDCDTVSALTRVALQAGVPMQEVPAASREGARWRLIRAEDEAQAAEGEWLRLHLADRRAATPVNLLSRFGLLALGPGLLHAGNGSKVTAAATLAALLLALGAGWFGFIVAGFVFSAIASVLHAAAATLRRVERASLSLSPPPLSRREVLGWLIDLVLIALVMWSAPLLPWESLIDRGFPPIILLALLRLTPRIVERGWVPWLDDRVLLALLLALGAAAGVLMPAVQLLALLLALAAMIFPGGKSRITSA